jgi:hypothetical protein
MRRTTSEKTSSSRAIIFDDVRSLAFGIDLSILADRVHSLSSPSETRTAACYPSADEINALPEKSRQYIHDLETRTEQEWRCPDHRTPARRPRSPTKACRGVGGGAARLRGQLPPSK